MGCGSSATPTQNADESSIKEQEVRHDSSSSTCESPKLQDSSDQKAVTVQHHDQKPPLYIEVTEAMRRNRIDPESSPGSTQPAVSPASIKPAVVRVSPKSARRISPKVPSRSKDSRTSSTVKVYTVRAPTPPVDATEDLGSRKPEPEVVSRGASKDTRPNTQPEPEEESQPPLQWVPHVSEDGLLYFFNDSSGKSIWELPKEDQVVPTYWSEHVQDGQVFYFNSSTGETSWELVPGAVVVEPEEDDEDLEASVQAATEPGTPKMLAGIASSSPHRSSELPPSLDAMSSTLLPESNFEDFKTWAQSMCMDVPKLKAYSGPSMPVMGPPPR